MKLKDMTFAEAKNSGRMWEAILALLLIPIALIYAFSGEAAACMVCLFWQWAIFNKGDN